MIKQEWGKFKLIFFEKCCRLICKVKPNAKPNEKEELITYDYVEKIKKIDWSNSIRVECASQQRSGTDYNKLKNPDITFSTLDNKLKTFFECKRLGSNSKYIAVGVKRFVFEDYGFKNMPFYGMLGYVEKESALNQYDKLKSAILKKREDLNLLEQSKIKNSQDEILFQTKHRTKNQVCNDEIEITHILHSWS